MIYCIINKYKKNKSKIFIALGHFLIFSENEKCANYESGPVTIRSSGQGSLLVPSTQRVIAHGDVTRPDGE
jgi:hypothetical protein